MTHTTQEINSNFRIKLFGRNKEGRKINTLVGVSGLIDHIGDELSDKFINKAFDSLDDIVVCRLRRGLKISFYAK